MKTVLKKTALILPLVASVLFLQNELDIRRVKSADRGMTQPLPNVNFLKAMSLGHEEMLADFYWVKAVLYEGGEMAEDRNYNYFASLIDLVTTLDPHFQYPYLFGSVILSVVAQDYEGSDKILMKGYTLHNDSWRFPFGLGYNAFFYHGDARKAARYIGVAARMEDHPPYLPRLASRLYYESGNLDLAIRFLATILHDIKDEEQRMILQKRVEALKIILNLENMVARYRQDRSEEPEELIALVRAGYIDQLPTDPYGGSFYLDGEGSVFSTSKLRPVHSYSPEGGA